MIMAREHGVLIAGEVEGLKGDIFRIGHMGHTARMDNALVTIAALEKSLQKLGFPLKAGSGVQKVLDHF